MLSLPRFLGLLGDMHPKPTHALRYIPASLANIPWWERVKPLPSTISSDELESLARRPSPSSLESPGAGMAYSPPFPIFNCIANAGYIFTVLLSK